VLYVPEPPTCASYDFDTFFSVTARLEMVLVILLLLAMALTYYDSDTDSACNCPGEVVR
jgi:hypothetical protein